MAVMKMVAAMIFLGINTVPSGAPGLHALLNYFGINFVLITLTLTPLIVVGINFKSVIGALWGHTCTLEITLTLLNCFYSTQASAHSALLVARRWQMLKMVGTGPTQIPYARINDTHESNRKTVEGAQIKCPEVSQAPLNCFQLNFPNITLTLTLLLVLNYKCNLGAPKGNAKGDKLKGCKSACPLLRGPKH